MHFDIIIGNPPYQLADGGAGASARPIYHLFIEQAIQMNPEYLSMIVPSRWMIGGKGLDKFRKNMIEDRHIEKLFDFLDEKKCFSTTIITGGVCYFVWNRNFNGKCLITTNTLDGKIQHSKRYLDEGDAEIFIRSDFLISIKNKALSLREKTMDSIVSASKPYGFRAETMLNAEKFGLPKFSDRKNNCEYEIIGLNEKKQRVWKFLPKDYPIPKISNSINSYKLFVSEADGAAGQIGNPVPARIIGKPLVAFPKQICTETFLEIGPFKTKEEAENIEKYLKTKFSRILIGIQKQTQHTTQKVYRFVPIQDFTLSSDIDWSQTVDDIDEQLFKKYSLSEEEINYIKENIQEMV